MGRVPAAEIGNQAIFESSAICSYLADQYLDKGLAPALSSSERAIYQQWMYFAASTIDPVVARIMIIEDIPAGELRTQKESALLEDLRDAMIGLNHTLSKDSYLVGNRFSAADICVSYHLYFCQLWPELDAVVQEFPNVVSYMKRMMERPAAIEAKVFTFPA
jgi:glutathione S-transferase